jgi:hypothetical protein
MVLDLLRRYRRNGWRGCAVSGRRRLLRRRKRIAWLDELGMGENRAGDHIQPHRKEEGSEERSGDFDQFVRIQLVARFSQIDGYRYLSLIRASTEVNCQSALAWLTFRSTKPRFRR